MKRNIQKNRLQRENCTHHDNTNYIFFIHGAYQSPVMWSSIIDDILLRKENCECITLSIPGYYMRSKNQESKNIVDDALAIINKYSKNRKEIMIVAHSLGGIFACILLEKIKDKKITLLFSSMPLYTPKFIVEFRLIMEKVIYGLAKKIPIRYIPFILRPKFLTNYNKNNILRVIIAVDFLTILNKNKNKIKHIHIACGKIDFLSGGIKNQCRLIDKIKSFDISASFNNFGFTGHYPYLLNKYGYVEWILDGFKHT